MGRGGKEVRVESDEANDSDKDQAEDPSLSKHGKLKDFLDPLNAVRKYLGTEGIERVIRLSEGV